MPRLITKNEPAVICQEQTPARPDHVFELTFAREDCTVVQFFRSLAMWKWVGWTYEQVPTPQRRRFEAQHAGHRLSPGLYRVPSAVSES